MFPASSIRSNATKRSSAFGGPINTPTAERLAADELGDEIARLRLRAGEIVDVEDVGVVQPRHRVRLAIEALAELRIGGEAAQRHRVVVGDRLRDAVENLGALEDHVGAARRWRLRS